MPLRALLILGLTFFAAVDLYAYGAEGHQLVGAIADERLANTPTAAKLQALLDGLTLQKASVIADEIKGWDKNGPDAPGIFHYTSRPRIDAALTEFWKANPPTHDEASSTPSHHWFHYTDVPLFRGERYGDGTIGRGNWDIVNAMRYCIAVLRGDEPEENPRKITKPIAVILLAHFVGDIHQPLHVGAPFFNERGEQVDPSQTAGALPNDGGNTLTLEYSQAAADRLHHLKSNFHSFWDTHSVSLALTDLPPEMPKEERQARIEEARKGLAHGWAVEEPKDWRLPDNVSVAAYPEAWADEILPLAKECHERLNFREVHPQQIELRTVATGVVEGKQVKDGAPYEEWASGVVRDQLHKAGWRLADLLEKALEGNAPVIAPSK